jgi:Tat protein secretion system quality control protein TatD with DNase activity
MDRLLPLVLWQVFVCSLATDLHAEPLADVHLHWKWNHKEVTPPEVAIAALRSHEVALAVVTGTPPELALELAELAPDIVRPSIGIYPHSGDWPRWHHDPSLLRRTRAALESGRYFGIGEVHLIGGFISHWENPIIDGLFRLAAEFDVPILVHTEFSRPDYMLGLCQAHPATRLLWAHAGSILPPQYGSAGAGGLPKRVGRPVGPRSVALRGQPHH